MPTRAHPVALVTGGANGIGRATARHLIDNGWRVGVLDLPGSGLHRAFPRGTRRVALIEGDAGIEETAPRAVAAILERFGGLDALVSNAGIMIRKPLRRLTLAEWHRVLDTNLTATFLLARAAEKPLRKAHGSIVTIVALTHALAVSLGPDIRVNCVSPGWIETKDQGALRRKDHAQHPAGRVGKPQDIAEIVFWLLDRERSGFVTGANFVVDGGMTRKMIYVE
jgi:NAD(P)-dependent dehydrogenase (short-subunit alcohol dehydrogenase family)